MLFVVVDVVVLLFMYIHISYKCKNSSTTHPTLYTIHTNSPHTIHIHPIKHTHTH